MSSPDRKVVLYTLTSLDGSVEDPTRYFPDNDPSVSGAPILDPVMSDLEARLIERQDTVLLGRHMYDEWARYWPTSDEQPFADFINSVQKYVATSSPLSYSWQNAEAVHTPFSDFVRELKTRPGRDIGVHGSIELARSLIADTLVDEIHLAVGPVIDQIGPRLFAGLPSAVHLELVGVTPGPSGAVWMHYRFAGRA